MTKSLTLGQPGPSHSSPYSDIKGLEGKGKPNLGGLVPNHCTSGKCATGRETTQSPLECAQTGRLKKTKVIQRSCPKTTLVRGLSVPHRSRLSRPWDEGVALQRRRERPLFGGNLDFSGRRRRG